MNSSPAIVLATALALAAQTGRQFFEQARAAERAGDWAAAEKAYRQVVRADPASAEARANLGVVLARQGRYPAAIAEYRAALKLRPSLHAVYLNLGIAHFKADEPARAVAALRQYLKVDVTNQQARQILASALLETGEAAEAAAIFEALPNPDFSARLGLAAAYIRLGRDAGPQLQSLAAEGEKPEVQTVLGQAYLARNDFAQARQAFARALELSPQTPGLHFLLGAVEWRAQNMAAAIEHWRAGAAAEPASFELHFALAAALIEQGDPTAAQAPLARARAMRPAHPGVLYYQARLAWRDKQPAAAALFERCLQADPANRAARYLLGQVYLHQGRRAEASRQFAQVRRMAAEGVTQDVDILEQARGR